LPWRPGCGLSPIVKTTDTRREFCLAEWEPERSTWPPFGTMYAPCEREYLSAQSTSSPEDSPARISALREMESAWKESEAGYSLKLCAWHASFDRDSFSWKTSQLSLFEGLTEFSWSSLRSGTIVDGRLYQPPRLEPRTSESDGFYLPTPIATNAKMEHKRSGGRPPRSYLPTPTATEYGTNQTNSPGAKVRPSLSQMARMPTPRASDGDKSGADIETLVGFVRALWPTPRTTGLDGGSNSRKAAKERDRWPTPRAEERGQYQRDRGEKGKERPTLTGRALGYPTPTSRDWKDGLTPKPHGRHSPSVAVAVAEAGHPGFLNPQFVEVLMGYSIGWTALEDWATQWFRSKRGRRSKDLSESKGVG
jgi:hypothetical protein